MENIGLTAIFEDSNFQAGIKRYQQGINQASSATERGASVMSRLGSVASGALVVGIGAATAALGAFSAVSKIGIDAALAQGEAIDKLGDMFGLSAKQANTWATAFTHFGVPVEEAAQQINFFTRGLAETTKVAADGKVTLTPFGESLKKLGVSAYDSKGKLKTFDQIMPQIMDQFAKLPNGVNKSALAMDLFGARGGSKFLDFLSAGSGALTDATKRVEEFGGMTDEQRDAIEQFGFALNDTRDNLQKVWSQIGLQLLPILRKFVDFINVRVLPAFSQWVREYLPRIISKLGDLWKVIQQKVLPIFEQVSFIFQDVIGMFTNFSQPVGDASNQLEAFAADVASLANYLGLGGFDTEGTILGIANAISILSEAVKKGDWSKVLIGLDTLKTRFWNWLTGKGGALEQAGAQLGKVVGAIQSWLNANAPSFAATFAVWKTQFWNWLTDPNSGVIAAIAENMGKLTDNIKAWSESPETQKQFVNIGKTIARTIIRGIGDLFSNPSEGENILMILARNIARALWNLLATFRNIGRNLALGIITGIDEEFVSPAEAARIGRATVDALENAVNFAIQYGNIPALMFRLASFGWEQFTKAWALLTRGWNPFATPSAPPVVSGGNAAQWGGTGEKYANGGFVRHTGLALVHAGEYVIPAPNVTNSRVSNFTFNHNWPASVPATARGWTEQMVRTVTQQEVRSILDRV